MAQPRVDRSSGPFRQGVRLAADNLVSSVEAMRQRFDEDIGSTLELVVDHAFVRALQLLLVAAVLAVAGPFLRARVRRGANWETSRSSVHRCATPVSAAAGAAADSATSRQTPSA